jgi:epsilon-lactone hydrolase
MRTFLRKRTGVSSAVVIVLVLTVCCTTRSLSLDAQSTDPENVKAPYVYVPSTVSARAQHVLRQMTGPAKPTLPGPNDIDGWQKVRKSVVPEDLVNISKENAEAAKHYHATSERRTLGGVPVVDVRPLGWKDDGKILLYTHGGGYVTGGPDSSLNAWVADETGLRIISIGYTLAPESKWDRTTDQVIAVFQALKKEGYKPKDMAIFGDSAGGGLAAGSVLKMRDKGLGMPSAVVLWSPWADITETGDTYVTLKNADPILDYPMQLKGAADAYADPKDQKNPYVSPVYGDYSKGFPPTLVQGGTKEIFLSDFVRQYRAIDNAGGTAVLDIYEGMPHVFQAFIFDSPESQQAMTKMKKFLAMYMGK